jgi:hypothetical protein
MKNGLSRREWIKCGFAGLALTAGHRALSAVPQVSITPVQAAKNVDLVLRGDIPAKAGATISSMVG